MQRVGTEEGQLITVGPPLYVPTSGGWPDDIGGRVYPEQRGAYSSAALEVCPRAGAPVRLPVLLTTALDLLYCSCSEARPASPCGPIWMTAPQTDSPCRIQRALLTCHGGSRPRTANEACSEFGGWIRLQQ